MVGPDEKMGCRVACGLVGWMRLNMRSFSSEQLPQFRKYSGFRVRRQILSHSVAALRMIGLLRYSANECS